MLIPTPITCKYRPWVNFTLCPVRETVACISCTNQVSMGFSYSLLSKPSVAPVFSLCRCLPFENSHCSCPLCFCHLGFFTPYLWRCEGLFLRCQCNFLVRNPQIPARDQPNPPARIAHVKQNHSLGNFGVYLCGAGGLKFRKKFLNCFHYFRKSTGNHDFI